jgi:hypothetical protein
MIILEANYAKKLGLPGYSSHQYSVSIRTELTDLSQVEEESTRLYQLLQTAVDKDIQEVGFIPNASTYGTSNGNSRQHNGHPSHGHARNGNGSNGNGTNGNHAPRAMFDRWNCTDGQKGLIQRIVNENSLDKTEVEDLANQLFGLGVKQVNKMQASQLIEELLAKTGQSQGRARWQKPQQQAA